MAFASSGRAAFWCGSRKRSAGAGDLTGALVAELSGALALGGAVDVIEQMQVVPAEQEREGVKEGDGGVKVAPEERDTAEGAGDDDEQKHADAGEEAEVDDPAVAEGIAVGAEEEEGEEDVGEGEGVCAEGKEGGGGGGRGQGEVDAEDPIEKGGSGAEVGGAGKEVEEGLRLAQQGKAGEAFEEQAGHQKGEAEADAGEEARSLGRADLRKRRHGDGMRGVGRAEGPLRGPHGEGKVWGSWMAV